MYTLIRPLLFQLPTETAHALALTVLDWMEPVHRRLYSTKRARSIELWGLKFTSAVGLAAGLDKNGSHIDGLAALGFGFIEIGTVTPEPQPGNLRPRLFRLPKARAIINCMGFNNDGIEQLLSNLGHSKYSGVLGINIGKNRTTPITYAVNDYLHAMERIYSFADYISINISSPNTPQLRTLQHGTMLENLLSKIKKKQQTLHEQQKKYVPLLVKVSPDLDKDQIAQICECFLRTQIDGVIATNTTSSRDGVLNMLHADREGGLSGAPLRNIATETLYQFHQRLGDEIPLIAAGGIMSANDAVEKIQAGAKLLQIYTGLIYQGPKLIQNINARLRTL